MTSSHYHLIYSYGSPSCMVYIYFCNVLIIMITTRLDPGWGLGQTFFIVCLYYLLGVCSYGLFYVNFCPYDSLFFSIGIRIVRYGSLLVCLYAICDMLYYVSIFFLVLYICFTMSQLILHVHKLTISGRLATLK